MVKTSLIDTFYGALRRPEKTLNPAARSYVREHSETSKRSLEQHQESHGAR
jgi:hypothetical protein